jgi:hypothetical protein
MALLALFQAAGICVTVQTAHLTCVTSLLLALATLTLLVLLAVRLTLLWLTIHTLQLLWLQTHHTRTHTQVMALWQMVLIRSLLAVLLAFQLQRQLQQQASLLRQQTPALALMAQTRTCHLTMLWHTL